MIEPCNPTFAPARARRWRCYLRDSFFRSWIGALQSAGAQADADVPAPSPEALGGRDAREAAGLARAAA